MPPKLPQSKSTLISNSPADENDAADSRLPHESDTQVSADVVIAFVPDSCGTLLSEASVLSAGESEVEADFDSGGFGDNVRGVSHDFFHAFGA